jgi:hypothetical protein
VTESKVMQNLVPNKRYNQKLQMLPVRFKVTILSMGFSFRPLLFCLVVLFMGQLVRPCLSYGQLFHDMQITGYLKSVNLIIQGSPLDTYSSGVMTSNQQRADMTGWAGDFITFELALENSFTYSQIPLSDLNSYVQGTINHGFDLERQVYKGTHSQDTLYVDRFNITTQTENTRLTLGRQAIGFGRIALVSPLDVISPFSPEAIDREVRPGVDAIYGVYYFGLAGQVGGTAVFGETDENNSYLMIFSHNVGGVDLLAMVGSLQDRPMAGGGLATDIGGWGLKGEMALYKGKNTSQAFGDIHSSFAIGAVEGWYRFENGLNFQVEYLYNGAGVNDPNAYATVLSSAFTMEGLNYLMGKHYLLMGPSYELHPLVELEGLVLWNLKDSSFFIRPLVDISLAENLDLQIFWAFNVGEKPIKDASMGQAFVPGSEFGTRGDYGGIYFKFYF